MSEFTPSTQKSDFVKYYEIFKKIPTLKAKDERDLLELVKNGDQEALDKFIMSNIRLVMYRVLQFCSHNDPRSMDLVSEGTIGLMKAIELFDLSRNLRFSTYAVWWINCHIRRGIKFHKKEKSTALRNLHRQFEQSCRILRFATGKEPTPEEIATNLGWNTHTLRIYQKFRNDSDLMGYLKGDATALPTPQEGPEDLATKKDVREQLTAVLKKLSSVEEDIIRRYHGLGYNKHTYEQIGNFYSMTKEWVRQTETKALRKLFILLREDNIPPELLKKLKPSSEEEGF